MRSRKNPPRGWRRIHVKGYTYRRRVKGRRPRKGGAAKGPKFKLIRVKGFSYWLKPYWIPCIEFEKRIVAMKKREGETVADMDRIYHSKRKTDVVNLSHSFVWMKPKRPNKRVILTTFRLWFWVYDTSQGVYYLFTRTSLRGADIFDYKGARAYCAASYDKIEDDLKKDTRSYLEGRGLVAWTAYEAFAPVPFHGGRPKGSKNKKRKKSRRRRLKR